MKNTEATRTELLDDEMRELVRMIVDDWRTSMRTRPTPIQRKALDIAKKLA